MDKTRANRRFGHVMRRKDSEAVRTVMELEGRRERPKKNGIE